MKNKPLFVSRMFILACLLFAANTALASFHKNIWPKWAVHNPLSQEAISHQEWQEFLSRCVVTNKEGINLVDYPHVTKAERTLLKSYINRMSQIDITKYNRNEQLAYWLNLYNALVVKTIADYYPIETIEDVNISPGLFSVGPWGANLVTVTGSQLSLDDIQNRIIRAVWNDPRTHYALNDGSIGDANLRKEAFRGDILDQQLNTAAREYINSLRGLQLIEGKLILSKIFDWYIDDFGGNEEDLIRHLSYFANEELRKNLQRVSSVDSYIYNWHLNSTVATS